MQKERFIFIDYLRAICILYIVGYLHLFNYTNAFPQYFNPFTLALTEITLGLFVFISGFLVHIPSIETRYVINFYKKRLIRIYPLYFLALTQFFLYGLNDGFTTIKSLFLISMVYAPAPLTLWFINMIMLFYLIAPIINISSKSLKQYLITVTLIVVLIIASQLMFKIVDFRLLFYFPCFCVGMYCGENGVENNIISIKYAIVCLLFGTLAYGIQYMMNVECWDCWNIWTISNLFKIPFIVSISYLIFALIYYKREAFINIKIVDIVSYSSYSMYLFHRPIFTVLKSFYFPENITFQTLYLFCFCLLLIILISYCIQLVYDKLCVVADNSFWGEIKQ